VILLIDPLANVSRWSGNLLRNYGLFPAKKMLNDDYKEMLQLLKRNEVRFLIVGAYAMGAYGYPRATGDMDIWIMASSENSQKVFRTLKEFGAPLTQINETTFAAGDIVFQIGVAPRRIDIITAIDGVEFNEAWQRRVDIDVDGLKVPFISKSDLIKNKESTGRDKDSLDVKYLKSNQ
jgi:hypothetical protein